MATRKSKKRKTPAKKHKFRKWLLTAFLKLSLGALMFMVIFLSLVYIGMFGRIPTTQDLQKVKNQTATEVYSIDKHLIGKFYIENRRSIDNKSISPHVKNALVATEDSRFFEHNGLDYISLGRVMVKTILLGDHSQGGGSTISQQLAKNLFPRKKEGLLWLPISKAKEMFTAARLEQAFSKEEILSLYLNTVPFGENTFGIEVAANRFFSKSSSALEPHEAATLVGMLAANTRYSPRIHPEQSLERRNVVLDRMAEQSFLKKPECEKYKAKPMGLKYHVLDHQNGPAPYFLEQVRIQAAALLKEEYGDSISLFTSGLRIYTTLNSQLQTFANQAVTIQMQRLQKEFENHWKQKDPWSGHPEVYVSALKRSQRYQLLKKEGLSEEKILTEMERPIPITLLENGKEKTVRMSPADSVKHALRQLHAGFLAVNPSNGHILAWVGGTNFKFYQYDHVTSQRQVGSTFKPFVYATALEEGYEPCDYLSNERRIYRLYKNWSPANADGQHEGYYSLQGALIHSVNTIAAELTVKTGPHDVIDLVRAAGIKSDIPDEPSIGLGTANLSLLEMITAYTAFANYGTAIEPVAVLRIEDTRGQILYQAEPAQPLEAAFGEETARLMNHMLQGVIERGTGKSLRGIYRLRSNLAGKTGTTQDNADGWFIGFNPGIVAGAWVGADSPAVHFRSTALGQGAHTALPIFARFMQQAERTGILDGMGRQTFFRLPDYLADKVDCEDFSIEDPDIGFFQKLFGRKTQRPDSTNIKIEKERKKEEQKKSLLEKMKDLFKKK